MGNSAEEVLTHLSLHLSLSSPPPPSPSSAGTFSMMRFQATNAFAQPAVPFTLSRLGELEEGESGQEQNASSS